MLEKLSKVKREELIKDFLLKKISLLNKKHPKSQSRREDAIRVLSNDELRNFYNKGMEEGVLQPMLSFKECMDLHNKMGQVKNESKGIIGREERKVNFGEVDTSIISVINDIKKCREAIMNCKNFQYCYIQEKKNIHLEVMRVKK